MGVEIERKFLLQDDSWKTPDIRGIRIRQGYLHRDPCCAVRVRLAGERGSLTLKGKTTSISRTEFEYEIPAADARSILSTLCPDFLIDKTRYSLNAHGMAWVVDVFHGENEGLTIAEIELDSEDQEFERPGWLGREVSDDPRYFNASLAGHPFSRW